MLSKLETDVAKRPPASRGRHAETWQTNRRVRQNDVYVSAQWACSVQVQMYDSQQMSRDKPDRTSPTIELFSCRRGRLEDAQ